MSKIFFCRSFKPRYQRQTSYRGIKTNRYVANIGDFANDPELNCFCDAPDSCPPKGIMDLFKCMKAPMYASMPHFLDSDPELLKNVKGLSPDVNEHGIEIDFEPVSLTITIIWPKTNTKPSHNSINFRLNRPNRGSCKHQAQLLESLL